jgi:uncharacterized protein
MAHLISMIVNGVFDRFPRLKFALIEGGWSWLPHVVWRLLHEYKSLRQEIPWVKRLPSEHIVKSGRVVLSTQPAEDLSADQWLKLIDLMGSDELLVFSSDYPHWDFEIRQNDPCPPDCRRTSSAKCFMRMLGASTMKVISR